MKSFKVAASPPRSGAGEANGPAGPGGPTGFDEPAGPDGNLRARAARAASSGPQNLAIAVACVVILAAIVVLAGYGLNQQSAVRYWENFLRAAKSVGAFVFQPGAIVLLVALALQYLILKSGDRTRLLQLELDRLRVKRREEIGDMRRAREGLERMKKMIETPQADMAPLGKEVDALIEVLRPPDTRLLGGENREPAQE